MDVWDGVSRPLNRDEVDGPGPQWRLRVLSLDGGGVRGVITLAMLKAIEDAIERIEGKEVKIRDYFDVIGGTSTGGIIALGLASGVPIERMDNMYRTLPDEVLAGNSIPYDEEPLEKNLKKILDENRTMASIPEGLHVVITTVREDRARPLLVLINNYDDAQDEFEDWPLWKIARATSAVPMMFKRVDDKFVDGGVMANCPAMDILTKVFNHERNAKKRSKDGIMLSMGTGIEPEKPSRDGVFDPFEKMVWARLVGQALYGRDIADTTRLLNSGFSRGPHMTDRTRAWCDMIGMEYHHMDPPVEAGIPWDCKDQTKIQGMVDKTKEYLDSKFETKIDDIAKKLVDINNKRLAELGLDKAA